MNAMFAVSLIPFIIIFGLFLVVPIIIGVYVYRDATERGMNALLWTLVAVFVPSLIGLIIYLIFRENYSSLSCANCGEKVQSSYVTCPSCGASLKEKCPACGTAVEAYYNVCPRCSAALSHDGTSPVSGTTVSKKGNGGLIAILVIVVLLPLLLIVLLGGLFFVNRVETTGSSEYEVPQEDFFNFEDGQHGDFYAMKTKDSFEIHSSLGNVYGMVPEN